MVHRRACKSSGNLLMFLWDLNLKVKIIVRLTPVCEIPPIMKHGLHTMLGHSESLSFWQQKLLSRNYVDLINSGIVLEAGPVPNHSSRKTY